MRQRPGAGAAYGMGAVLIVMGGFTIAILLIQARSLRQAQERVHRTIVDVAARAFDAPPRVVDGYDGAWLIGPLGGMSTLYDGKNFTMAEGTARGARLIVASHPSVAGRQMFEQCHVYSYVAVDAPGVSTPFRLSEQAAGTKFIASVVGSRDVEIGDPAFDQTFLIDSDAAFAARVLDPGLRARLIALRAQVRLVSQDFGAGRMTLALNGGSLVLRWPGELSVDFTIGLRDLLLDLRARFLEVARG
jgi:hypothetical protein